MHQARPEFPVPVLQRQVAAEEAMTLGALRRTCAAHLAFELRLSKVKAGGVLW